MHTLTQDLTVKTTEAEDLLMAEFIAAAICDPDEYRRLYETPVIEDLFRRGALRLEP